MTKEEITKVIDEAEYNLMDGMGLGGYKRQYTTDEYELIEAIMNLLRKRFEVE